MPQHKKTPLYNMTEKDKRLLTGIIYSEAGNLSQEGKLKVGAVVRNRYNDPAYPDTVEGVITQPNQFAGTKTPRWDTAMDPHVLNKLGNGKYTGEYNAFRDSMAATDLIDAGKVPDDYGKLMFFKTYKKGVDPSKVGEWVEQEVRKGNLKRRDDLNERDSTGGTTVFFEKP